MAGIGSAGRWWTLLAGLLALNASEPADAGKVTLTASDVGYIESDGPRPEGRILVRFELPEEVLAGEVEFAVLELRAPVTADEGVSCVVVDAFPLTAEWDGATVSWDGSWSTPGGDYDRTEHAVWIARPDEGSVLRFDATDMVAGWASGTIPNNGLVLLTSPGWPGAIGASDAQGADPAAPTLRVYCPRCADSVR
jgi:hypothetical protein